MGPGSEAQFLNCIFSNNTTSYSGGGLLATDSNPTLKNCILWGNSDEGGTDESAQIHEDGTSTADVTYSCVQDDDPNDASVYPGTGNIDDDPLFVNADGPDDVAGTEDDNLRLSDSSPCIDAGDNTAVPRDVADLDNDGNTVEQIPYDLDGNPRFLDEPGISDTGNGRCPIVDMGAYEFVGSPECIPTVSDWGVVAMTLLVLAAGTVVLRQRRASMTAG